MKKLHKKIGVGVLVAGLLAGGVGFSGGSVAHAGSMGISKGQSVLERMENLGKQLEFDVFIDDGSLIPSNKLLLSGYPIRSYEEFERIAEGLVQLSRSLRKPFMRVSFENKNFIIVF